MHTNSFSQIRLLAPSSHKIFSKSHKPDSSINYSDALYAQKNNLSVALIDKALRFLSHGKMTVSDIRKTKLEALISEYGGLRILAEAIGHSSSAQISQWRNSAPDSKTGKPRTISNRSARYIELKCNKPVGWMDSPNQDEQSAVLNNFQWILRHGEENEKSILLATVDAIMAAHKEARKKEESSSDIDIRKKA